MLWGTKLGRPAYLFWLDQDYGAEFEHPSTLLLVDARSGATIVRRGMLWPPLVDGKPTAFTATSAGYDSARDRLFARLPVLKAPGPVVTHARREGTRSELPAGTFAHDCMIMIGDRANPTFAGSFAAMKQWANGAGLDNSYAIDKNDLATEVKTFTGAGCTDVLVYLAGSASRRRSGTTHGPASSTRAPRHRPSRSAHVSHSTRRKAP